MTEEVFTMFNISLFITWRVVDIQRCYLEHCACTFSVGTCDDRRIDVEEATNIKELMNSDSHRMAHPHYRSECVGTTTQVCYFSEEFERMFLGLKRKFFRVAISEDNQVCHLYF